jgi:hypothetical protein
MKNISNLFSINSVVASTGKMSPQSKQKTTKGEVHLLAFRMEDGPKRQELFLAAILTREIRRNNERSKRMAMLCFR